MLHSSVMSFGCSAHQVPADQLRHVPRGVEVDRPLDRNEHVQTRLARRLDDGLERHALQQLAQPERHFLAFLERDRVELGLGALRLLAGIDVRIEVEQHVVGVVQHRGLERCERARVVGALRHCVRAGLRARMPDVELERPRLREPQQRRQVVAQQVVVLLVLVRGEHGDRSRRTRAAPAPSASGRTAGRGCRRASGSSSAADRRDAAACTATSAPGRRSRSRLVNAGSSRAGSAGQ